MSRFSYFAAVSFAIFCSANVLSAEVDVSYANNVTEAVTEDVSDVLLVGLGGRSDPGVRSAPRVLCPKCEAVPDWDFIPDLGLVRSDIPNDFDATGYDASIYDDDDASVPDNASAIASDVSKPAHDDDVSTAALSEVGTPSSVGSTPGEKPKKQKKPKKKIVRSALNLEIPTREVSPDDLYTADSADSSSINRTMPVHPESRYNPTDFSFSDNMSFLGANNKLDYWGDIGGDGSNADYFSNGKSLVEETNDVEQSDSAAHIGHDVDGSVAYSAHDDHTEKSFFGKSLLQKNFTDIASSPPSFINSSFKSSSYFAPYRPFAQFLSTRSKPTAKFVGPGLSSMTGKKKKRAPVTILDFAQMDYVGYVQVGPKVYKVVYDTGSQDLWVPSKYCDTCHSLNEFLERSGKKKKTLYDRDISPTYKPIIVPAVIKETDKNTGKPVVKAIVHTDTGTPVLIRQPFQILYGSGPIEGIYANDTLRLGDSSELVVPEFTFAEATEVKGLDPLIRNTSFDGVLGLGWNKKTSKGYPTILSRLVESKAIDEPVFSFYLGQNDGAKGELLLGGVDESLYKGKMVYFPVVNKAYHWTIGLKGAYIGKHDAVGGSTAKGVAPGTEINAEGITGGGGAIMVGGQSNAVVDSGTTLIHAPDSVVQNIYKILNAYTFPSKYGSRNVLFADCDVVEKNPLSFELIGAGQRTYRVVIEKYAFREMEFRSEWDPILNREKKVRSCRLGIASSEFTKKEVDGKEVKEENNEWILGDVFMRKYFTAFDYRRASVGLAVAKKDALLLDRSAEVGKKTVSKEVPSEVSSGSVPPAAGVGSGGSKYYSRKNQPFVDPPNGVASGRYSIMPFLLTLLLILFLQ